MPPSKALRHAANPAADPARPYDEAILTRAGFAEASAAVTAWPGHAPTPLLDLPGLADRFRIGRLLLKDEGRRLDLKSFKALGGAYAVQHLVRQHGRVTVTCATDGNHGRAVAWGARTFGARAVIFMPEAVSEGRAAAIAAYGAEVRRAPGTYDDVVAFAEGEAKRQGWHLVADTLPEGSVAAETPARVMHGYGVMAEEAIAQMAGEIPTHVIAQAGVGALAAALSARFRLEWGARSPRLIVVEPESADCVFAAIEEGGPVRVEGDLETMMGGLSCGEISALAWPILRAGAADALAIGDGWVPEAMRLLARNDPPVVAGETGCAGIAALLALTEAPVLKHRLGLSPDSCVLVINSEGDTDPALYRQIIEG